MSRLLSVSTLAALLVLCATPRAGEGSAESAGAAGSDSPAFCTSYSTGSDTHTICAPPTSAPQGSAIICHDYTVGSDAHAECAPVPAPRLGGPRGLRALPVPLPASALRCSTYHIGSAAYTDCR